MTIQRTKCDDVNQPVGEKTGPLTLRFAQSIQAWKPADDMFNKTCTRRKLTRKEQRDLDIEISFVEGVVTRDPLFVEAWKVLSDAYTRRGKLDLGLKVDEHLARIRPEDMTVLYNLACSYSLAKSFDDAANALTRALSNGFTDFKWLMKDPDLSPLRKEPPFKKIWARISACTSSEEE